MKYFDLEKASDLGPSFFLMGVDEVGRGPLAGPVVSCAVKWVGKRENLEVCLESLSRYQVTDSKKISAKKRIEIIKSLDINLIGEKAQKMKSLKGVTFFIKEFDQHKIDEMNILQASLGSMEEAIRSLKPRGSGKILIDGNKTPQRLERFNTETIIKGDSKSLLIGLASIIAKEYRDGMMEKYEKDYPGYGFHRHAGYPTKAHREAIAKLGPSPIHRKSFKGVREYLK